MNDIMIKYNIFDYSIFETTFFTVIIKFFVKNGAGMKLYYAMNAISDMIFEIHPIYNLQCISSEVGAPTVVLVFSSITVQVAWAAFVLL